MRDIPRWQRHYLGLSTFPRAMSQVELDAFFTFSATELQHIHSRYKMRLRLAADLQLGFLKMTGRPLNAVRIVPPSVLQYIAAQLQVPAPTIASLRAIYRRRPRTLWEHQLWAMDILHFSRAAMGLALSENRSRTGGVGRSVGGVGKGMAVPTSLPVPR